MVKLFREKNITAAPFLLLTAVIKTWPGPLDDVYAELAGKYGVTEADVALRWCID